MSLFGIGPLELLLIMIIALGLVRPHDIGKATRSLGRFLNQLYHSEIWRALTQASHTLRELPTSLAQEAAVQELDEVSKTVNQFDAEVTQGVSELNEEIKSLKTPSSQVALSNTETPSQPEQSPEDDAVEGTSTSVEG